MMQHAMDQPVRSAATTAFVVFMAAAKFMLLLVQLLELPMNIDLY